MRQALHILRKDIRHLRLEILLELVLLAVYVWVAAQAWAESGYQNQMDEVYATALLVLSWWYLIARVVLDEPLVGDRQFWITRPYNWRSLLAAKFAFVVLCINLPLLFAQAVLLRLAGYPPSTHVGGLMWLQLTNFLVLLLPAGALMAVLGRKAQYALIALAVPAFYLPFMLGWFFTGQSGVSPLAWIRNSGIVAVIAVAVLIVISLQYRRRRTAISRAVLAGGLVLALFGVPPAIPWNSIIALRYRDQSAWPVIAFAPHQRVTGWGSGNSALIWLPVQVSEIPENSTFLDDAMRVTIEAPGGESWHTGWLHQGPGGQLGSSDIPDRQFTSHLTLDLDRNLYEKIKAQPVRVHIELAIRLLRARQVVSAALTRSGVPIADVGTCYLPDSGSFRCRTALREPRLLAVTAKVIGPECLTATGTPPPDWRDFMLRSSHPELYRRNLMANAQGVISSESPYPADPGINPIKTFRSQMRQGSYSNTFPNGALGTLEYFCPGTTLSFTTQETVGHVIRTLDIRDIRLADYAAQGQ